MTVAHVFIAYFLHLPLRGKLSLSALLFGAALPDIEPAIYALQAAQVCTTVKCAADWPSHFMVHSFLGIFLVVAPLAVMLVYFLKKRMRSPSKKTLANMYASAALGGLLHIIPDLTVHVPPDILHVLWPVETVYQLNFIGAGLLWDVVAILGAVVFYFLEMRKNNSSGRVLKT